MAESDGGAHDWLADLALAAALALVAAAALLAPGVPWPLEWLLGVPLLLVLPGYALLAALFPGGPSPTGGDSDGGVPGGPGWVARLALSLGANAVLVAAVGLLLTATVGLRLGPLVGALVAVTLVGLALAAWRRRSVDPPNRARPFAVGVRSLRGATGGSTAQTVTMGLAVLALVATLAYTGAVPADGEAYSELSLLSETDDGDLVAAANQTTVEAGQELPLHVGVENHEGRATEYEVVVLAQRVGEDGAVTEQRELDRIAVGLDDDESTVLEREVSMTTAGDAVRVQALLYEGTAPDDPDPNSADVATHRWVTVVDDTG